MAVEFLFAVVALAAAFLLTRRSRLQRQEVARNAAAVEAEGLRRAAEAEVSAQRARADVEARQTVLAVETAAHQASIEA